MKYFLAAFFLLNQSAFAVIQDDQIEVEVIKDKDKMSKLIDPSDNNSSLQIENNSIAMPHSDNYVPKFNSHNPNINKNSRVILPKGMVTSSVQARENRQTNKVINDAYSAFKSGNIESSLFLYKSALEKYPSNIDALFGAAVAYQLLGHSNESSEMYLKILNIDPDNTAAKNNLLTLIAGKSLDKAIDELLKIDKNKPNQPFILAQLGTLYSHQKKYDLAVAYLGKAIENEPSNPYYAYNMAITLDKMGKYKDAYIYYEHSIEKITPSITLDSDIISRRMKTIKYKS